MKLLSYEHAGEAGFGAVVDGGIVDLKRALGGRYAGLRQLIAADAFAEAAASLQGRKPDHALDAVTLLPVIPDPDKIVCVGLNYGEHVRETGRTVTESPALFLRVPDSQVGHGQPILRPRESQRLDYEGEIAVVICRGMLWIIMSVVARCISWPLSRVTSDITWPGAISSAVTIHGPKPPVR